jgi:leucyl aminopeptidase
MKHIASVVLKDSKEFKLLDTRSGKQLSRASADLKEGEGVTLTCPNKIAAQYVRVENRKITSPLEARNFGGEMYTLFKSKADVLHFNITTKYNNDIQEGSDLAGYQFLTYKSDAEPNRLQAVEIKASGTTSIAPSINYIRDLITEPGNVLYPREYAKRIKNLLEPTGVTVKVYPAEELREMGFNLLLSVGQGSCKDSQVVVMEWMRGGKAPVTALVGKGVTFDSGGISLKPGKGMGDMKYDMAGSAAVVGAMHALSAHHVNANVVGIVGLVENMPDGNSIKPGDVVTSLSGKTVENLNTDAEGRLVLADILTHVQKYNPATIIDLATLTGAIMVALGTEMAGLFTNSTDLEKEIIKAGKTAGEGYWRMPMGKNWNKMIDSSIADMQNIGGAYGGSTTAAEFLYRFVDKDRAWAHLDIAGMAWADSATATTPKGAVGFGVRTLYNFITQGKTANLTIDPDMKY